MTLNKVRRIDFYQDEYIAGVAAKLSAVDQGVYWMVCSLIYSRGGPIDDDHLWLSHLFADTHWRTVRSSLDRLIAMGKIERYNPLIDGAQRPQITVKRCARELQKAFTRSAEASQNGRTGGRPPKKNNEIAKPEAFSGEKLTTNHQPPTTNLLEDLCRKPASRRPSYPSEFEEFWKAYPTDSLMSKKEAATAWSKLTPEDHAMAIKAVSGFVAYCRKNQDYRPVHACRFLSQRRFEGFSLPNGAARDDDQPTPERKLQYGRKHRKWKRDWDAMPNQPGCKIPPDLIRPDDGVGWEIDTRWG